MAPGARASSSTPAGQGPGALPPTRAGAPLGGACCSAPCHPGAARPPSDHSRAPVSCGAAHRAAFNAAPRRAPGLRAMITLRHNISDPAAPCTPCAPAREGWRARVCRGQSPFALPTEAHALLARAQPVPSPSPWGRMVGQGAASVRALCPTTGGEGRAWPNMAKASFTLVRN